jgi:predicted dehydrogenase
MDDPQRCPAAPLTRLGIYLINDIISLFGRVLEVQVTTSRIFTGRPTPDNAQLSLLFENHAIGSIFASFCVENGQQYGNSMTLHYERGTILRNTGLYDYGKVDGFSELRMTCVKSSQQCSKEEWSFPGTSGHYQWALMHRILLDPACNPIPQFEIVHGIEVLESMARAERSGRRETVTSTP